MVVYDGNPKSEYRNPKQIKITKEENPKRRSWVPVSYFPVSDFEFVSDFDIRISSLHAGFNLHRRRLDSTIRESDHAVGVGPTDPLTLTGMVIVVVAITLVTCWIPARRATRVDPLAALRNE